MKARAIEGDIQEKILDVLPDEHLLAIEVMAQLSANICLSGKGFDVEAFCDKVRQHHDAYIEAEGQ